MGSDRDLSTSSSLESSAPRPGIQGPSGQDLDELTCPHTEAPFPQDRAEFSSQLEKLGQTVNELQGDIAVFKQRIQEATAQAATVKIIVAKELESRLSGFTTSALKSKAEVQLTSDQLAQALSGLAPTEAVEKPLVEHFFVQLQQQQANLFSNVSDIHQALAALLSELKHS